MQPFKQHISSKYTRMLVLISLTLLSLSAHALDHTHAAWTTFLKKNTVLISNGNGSQMNYKGAMEDRAALKAYLASLSAVSQAEFDSFSKADQLAFLINAYNAYTVEKILTKYPNLKSIKDFGTVFGNPWKDAFFKLLGKEMTLDGIEQNTIRKPGVYDEPRIHFAVNCASIGCPSLREEAYQGKLLDKQLEEQTVRFLSDRSRNRYNTQNGKLEVSKIFDWYKQDFTTGLKGIASREQFFAKYASQLGDSAEDQTKIRGAKVALEFLDYDWNLNDVKK
ncbi:MAG: DUF547 domain-containing protein [Burkholderiales bacterium]|jgi:hypothetical protein|nr:DUF547 domain-containing protein [Burkholderiales bacterium]